MFFLWHVFPSLSCGVCLHVTLRWPSSRYGHFSLNWWLRIFKNWSFVFCTFFFVLPFRFVTDSIYSYVVSSIAFERCIWNWFSSLSLCQLVSTQDCRSKWEFDDSRASPAWPLKSMRSSLVHASVNPFWQQSIYRATDKDLRLSIAVTLRSLVQFQVNLPFTKSW